MNVIIQPIPNPATTFSRLLTFCSVIPNLLDQFYLFDVQQRVGFDDYPGVEGALDRLYRLAVLVKQARGDLGIYVKFDLFLLRLFEIFFDLPQCLDRDGRDGFYKAPALAIRAFPERHALDAAPHPLARHLDEADL